MNGKVHRRNAGSKQKRAEVALEWCVDLNTTAKLRKNARNNSANAKLTTIFHDVNRNAVMFERQKTAKKQIWRRKRTIIANYR